MRIAPGHAIVVVDGEQGAPFVERRARMRDAASDKIADLRRFGGGEAQIRVLIVHVGDLPRCRRGLRRGVGSRAVAFARRSACRGRTTRRACPW